MTRRTQGERTAQMRQTLIDVARALFTEHGFAAVPAEAIVGAAGVSRGALYHHFADKTELFAAVFETVEAEVIARIAQAVGTQPDLTPVQRMRRAAAAWLDACQDPAIVRIALIEAPAVLGWARWREIGDRYGLALALELIRQAIAAGEIPPQPAEPLAFILLGVLRETALYAAVGGGEREAAGAVMDRLIAGLVGPGRSGAAGGREG